MKSMEAAAAMLGATFRKDIGGGPQCIFQWTRFDDVLAERIGVDGVGDIDELAVALIECGFRVELVQVQEGGGCRLRDPETGMWFVQEAGTGRVYLVPPERSGIEAERAIELRRVFPLAQSALAFESACRDGVEAAGVAGSAVLTAARAYAKASLDAQRERDRATCEHEGHDIGDDVTTCRRCGVKSTDGFRLLKHPIVVKAGPMLCPLDRDDKERGGFRAERQIKRPLEVGDEVCTVGLLGEFRSGTVVALSPGLAKLVPPLAFDGAMYWTLQFDRDDDHGWTVGSFIAKDLVDGHGG